MWLWSFKEKLTIASHFRGTCKAVFRQYFKMIRMNHVFARAFMKYLKLPLTAAWIFQSPCQSLAPRGYGTAAELWNGPCWTPAWPAALVSPLGNLWAVWGWGEEEGGEPNGRGKGERRRGGQHWIRLLIASLGGLLLRTRCSVLLRCRRQSDIRVTTACCKWMRFCSSRLGDKNRERRATWIRSH